jgi:hypothetical protein
LSPCDDRINKEFQDPAGVTCHAELKNVFESAFRIDRRFRLVSFFGVRRGYSNDSGPSIRECFPDRAQDSGLRATTTDPAVDDSISGYNGFVTRSGRGGGLDPQNAHQREGLIVLLQSVGGFKYLACVHLCIRSFNKALQRSRSNREGY